MFIKEGDREILPPWAKFVRGVIDSPALTPTAARDAVQQDRVHSEIQAVLGRLIIDTLQQMARNEPARFRCLMEWHHYGIKGMAIEFDDFFHAVADTVIFEINITEGHSFRTLTIPEYCKLQTETDDKGRKVIYYISEHGAAPSSTGSALPRTFWPSMPAGSLTRAFLKSMQLITRTRSSFTTWISPAGRQFSSRSQMKNV
jgi:HSP90 family molecular chaperone